ncbi:MAG: TIGR04282 family arsenosugar biosynthesis glycosyltransferase [Gammaproteobacteria bacterium]|nr:TIGR04282 family arsenosugar biosynthesis glycosyltransferase [Gammaproteobacteria bacterium]MCP5458861.1 TIGR04282 family arsenosugar biosynthesis glycosyltransferase [Gammaproteobacteria bacterium]
MEFPQGRILVFAKAPIPGQVKTRLAGQYGEQGAAHVYRDLARWTLDYAAHADLCRVQLWCAPDTRHGFFWACRRDYGVDLRTQKGIDLGRRMHHALSRTLRDCAYAILLGSDCASLNRDHLRSALRALAAGQDAVLGPAEDGGYVLVGLRQSCPRLFRNLNWSSRHVLPQTRQRLKQAGLRWLELPMGWDVDHPDAVRRWRQQCREF